MPNIKNDTLFTPLSKTMSYKKQVEAAIKAKKEGTGKGVDYYRIVMMNAIKTTTKDGKPMVLAEFGTALDQKDPSDLVKADARFGLKNNFKRDANGNFVDKEDAEPVVNSKGETVKQHVNSKLQPISEEMYNKIITTAAQTPRLDKDGNQVFNENKNTGVKSPIYYAVFEAPLRRVEKVVKDANGVEVRDPATGQARKDMYYAPVLEAAHFFQTDPETGKALKGADGKPVLLPAFDANKHFENAQIASKLPEVQAEAQTQAEAKTADVQATTAKEGPADEDQPDM